MTGSSRHAWLVGAAAAIVFVLGTITLLSAYDRIPEGHVGVLTRYGQAVRQDGPGFQWKTPFVEDYEIIEVRERRSTADMSVSARELPVSAQVSFNWSVNPTAAMRLFIEYGTIAQFEDRVVLPSFQQAVKAAIGGFSATDLLVERGRVAAAVEAEVRRVTERLPVTVASLQIENVDLPASYMEAVRQREVARQATERAEQELALQRVQAQQQVQSAQAAAEAARTKAAADAFVTESAARAQAAASLATAEAEAKGALARALAEAEGLAALGKARAEGLRLEAEALAVNPGLVELERARRWGGGVPHIVLGDGASPLPLLHLNPGP